MMPDIDGDLEDLESRLYSQVYHSNIDTYENGHVIAHVSDISSRNKIQNLRYFCMGRTAFNLNGEVNYIPSTNDQQNSKACAADFFNINQDDARPVLNTHSHLSLVPNPINNQAFINQMSSPILHMINPCNNILVLSPTPQQIISTANYSEPGPININIENYLDAQPNRRKRKQRWERVKQKRKERKRWWKAIRETKEQDSENLNRQKHARTGEFMLHHLREDVSVTTQERDEVVTISDSDNDDSSVEHLEETADMIVVSSGESDTENENTKDVNNIETKNKKDNLQSVDLNCTVQLPQIEQSMQCIQSIEISTQEDDDVLFVDDMSKHAEVIEIDCDSKSVTNVENSKVSSSKSLDSASFNSPMKKVDRTLQQKAITAMKERNELLQTPDSTSTSNDFLDNSIDMQQKKFDFGLHGTDFKYTETFLKPKSYTDIFETESSCSTSEISTPTKTSVFHEVDFESPEKDLFNEENLESFGNYITPTRSKPENISTPTAKFEPVLTKASDRSANVLALECSDTSSESDYELGEDLPVNRTKKVKHLPNLTDMSAQNTLNQGKISEKIVEPDKSKSASKKVVEPDKIEKVAEMIQESEKNEKGSRNVVQVAKVKKSSKPVDESEESSKKALHDLNNSGRIETISEELDEPEFDENYYGFSRFWTADMDKFYSSWGLENFNIGDIRKSMSSDPKFWRVLDEKRRYSRIRPSRNTRCRNCREYGHTAIRCRNKKRPIVCILCGKRGHTDARCNEAMCTLCGSEGSSVTYCSKCSEWDSEKCRLCCMFGHPEEKCPDLWRRYHLTTEPGPIVKPLKTAPKRVRDRWCAGCARPGHYDYKCKYCIRTHYPVFPHVKEYSDVYNFPQTQPFTIPFDFTNSIKIDIDELNDQPEKTSYISADKGRSSTSKNTFGTIDKPSTSRERSCTIAIETKSKRKLEREDTIQVVDNSQALFDGDREISEVGTSKVENIGVAFENFVFPTREMIPAYFRKQMGITEGNGKTGTLYCCNGNSKKRKIDERTEALLQCEFADISSRPEENNSHIFLEDYILHGSQNSPGVNTVRNDPRTFCDSRLDENTSSMINSHNSITINLNATLYGFMLSKKGVHLVSKFRDLPDISLTVTKSGDEPYPDGKIIICGNIDKVRDIKQQLLKLCKSCPKINILPRQSRPMAELLLSKIGKVERAAGNCKTLYRNLKALEAQFRIPGENAEIKRKIKFTKISLNMLLFGKLGLAEGKTHMHNLRHWQNEFNKKDNYKIPLNILFDILEAYSYIFTDTVNHQYQQFCEVEESSRHSPTRTVSDKEFNMFLHYYKLVETKCRKYNLSENLAELQEFRALVYRTDFSIRSFKEFMTFCNRFLRSVKQNLSL